MPRRLLAFLTVLAVASSVFAAANWPQWRGPNRDDISKETGLLKSWPSGGPKLDWIYKDAGLGYSGFSVVGQTLYTMGSRDGTEQLIAVDIKDGSSKWKADIGPIFRFGRWGDGPRGTPTVDGDRIYTMGGQGNVICVEAATGKPIWNATMKQYGGSPPRWGYCESLLVDGEQVICTPGGDQGAVIALNKKDGKLIWQSKDFTDGAQHSSPIVADHAGTRQYIVLTMESVAGIEAKTGKLLWRSNWPGKTAVIPTPIYHDSHVYVSSGYGVGCKLIRLDKDSKATDIYDNKVMANHHGGVILVGEHVYGYSDGKGWVCQNFKTGDMVWNDKSLGKGAIAYADGKFYLLDESSGAVALIEASPDGYTEISRFTLSPQTKQRAPQGKIWTHPVITDGKLYLRDQELLYCFDVKDKTN